MTDRELLREAREELARLTRNAERRAMRNGMDRDAIRRAYAVERLLIARIDAALAEPEDDSPREAG